MPDHTANSAADYLAAQGFTVGRRRAGGHGPPSADVIRRWCKRGKLAARRIGYIWLIDQAELDRLVEASHEQPSPR